MNITPVGLDLAKNACHVVGMDAHGNAQTKKRLWRGQGLRYCANLPPCWVGREACASAHYFARALTRLGYEVKRIAAQYVKASLRGQKNEDNDARAIAEAVRAPGRRLVRVKTVDSQDMRSRVRLREGALQGPARRRRRHNLF